jgi:hypothetical protein
MVVDDLDTGRGAPNEWVKGARWCIPARSEATEFRQYALAEVAKRYSEAGGSLPVKVYRSDSARLEYRCSSIPNKATEKKTKVAMKDAGLDYEPFSLSTACKFCVKFNWYAQKTEMDKPSGWYLTELNEDHSPGCDRPERARQLNFKVIEAAELPALTTFSLPASGKASGAAGQLQEIASKSSAGAGFNVKVSQSHARKFVKRLKQGDGFDWLRSGSKLPALLLHAKEKDPNGRYVLETVPMTFDIAGVAKDRAREISFVFVCPSWSGEYLSKAGVSMSGAMDAAHRKNEAGGIDFNVTVKTGSGEGLVVAMGHGRVETVAFWEKVWYNLRRSGVWLSVLRTDEHEGLTRIWKECRLVALLEQEERNKRREAEAALAPVEGAGGGAQVHAPLAPEVPLPVPLAVPRKFTPRTFLGQADTDRHRCCICQGTPVDVDNKWEYCGVGCLKTFCENRTECLEARIRHRIHCRPTGGDPFPGRKPTEGMPYVSVPVPAGCALHVLRNARQENPEGKKLMTNICNATCQQTLDLHLDIWERTFGHDSAKYVRGKVSNFSYVHLLPYMGPGETTFGEVSSNLAEQTNAANTLAREKDMATSIMKYVSTMATKASNMRHNAEHEAVRYEVTVHAQRKTEARANIINEEGWAIERINTAQVDPYPELDVVIKRHKDSERVQVRVSLNPVHKWWYERAYRNDLKDRTRLFGMPDASVAYVLVYLRTLLDNFYTKHKTAKTIRVVSKTLATLCHPGRSLFYADLFHINLHRSALSTVTDIFADFSWPTAQTYLVFLGSGQYVRARKRFDKADTEQRLMRRQQLAARQATAAASATANTDTSAVPPTESEVEDLLRRQPRGEEERERAAGGGRGRTLAALLASVARHEEQLRDTGSFTNSPAPSSPSPFQCLEGEGSLRGKRSASQNARQVSRFEGLGPTAKKQAIAEAAAAVASQEQAAREEKAKAEAAKTAPLPVPPHQRLGGGRLLHCTACKEAGHNAATCQKRTIAGEYKRAIELGVLNFKDAEALSDEQLQLLSGEDANADDAQAAANAGDDEPALYFYDEEGGAFADYVTTRDVVDMTGDDDDDGDDQLLRAPPTYDPMAAPAGKRVHDDDDDDDDDEEEQDDDGQGGCRRGGRGSKAHNSARASASAGGGASAAAGGIVDVSLGKHRYCRDCKEYVEYFVDVDDASVLMCSDCYTDV